MDKFCNWYYRLGLIGSVLQRVRLYPGSNSLLVTLDCDQTVFCFIKFFNPKEHDCLEITPNRFLTKPHEPKMPRAVVNLRTLREIDVLEPTPGREPHPTLRDDVTKHNPAGWLQSMAELDGHGELWAVNGQLYDLRKYFDEHPGGRQWVESTKGLDCTEMFQAHHIRSAVANKALERFWVGPVVNKKHQDRFTYDESFNAIRDFTAKYLKEKLKNPTGATPAWAGVMYTGIVAQFLVLAILAARKKSPALAFLAGICLCGCWGVGHNQMHRSRKGPWAWLRYALDLTGFSADETTTTHAMSHHLEPNTFLDVEVYAFSGLQFYWLTNEKKNSLSIFKYGAFLGLASAVASKLLIDRIVDRLLHRDVFRTDIVIPLALVATMCHQAKSTKTGLKLFGIMYSSFSLWFICTSLCIHHAYDAKTGAPLAYHEGEEGFERDFAKHQIVTVNDHSINIGEYLSTTVFAHLNLHTVHHMFPTIDHVYHRELLRAYLKENPGGFRDIYNARSSERSLFFELLPGVLRFSMERVFWPVKD